MAAVAICSDFGTPKNKDSWALKNWCFWTVVLEKILESPLDFREIHPVHHKGDQSWLFIGKTDVEAETPTLWPPDAKSWLICKDPDVGKNWGQEEKGVTEDKMVGWHHQLNGPESEQIQGHSEGQGSLVCCSPWGRKEWDTTEWTELNWTDALNQWNQYIPMERLRVTQSLWRSQGGRACCTTRRAWCKARRYEAALWCKARMDKQNSETSLMVQVAQSRGEEWALMADAGMTRWLSGGKKSGPTTPHPETHPC